MLTKSQNDMVYHIVKNMRPGRTWPGFDDDNLSDLASKGVRQGQPEMREAELLGMAIFSSRHANNPAPPIRLVGLDPLATLTRWKAAASGRTWEISSFDNKFTVRLNWYIFIDFAPWAKYIYKMAATIEEAVNLAITQFEMDHHA